MTVQPSSPSIRYEATNLSGKGTGSLSWWTPSRTRETSPMGCEARAEGRTTSLMVRPGHARGLRTGGQVDQHGALARLAVLFVRVLPVLVLDPLRKESVHERAHDGRGLAGAEDPLLLPQPDDLGVEAVADPVERGAYVGEPVAPGRVAQEVEEDQIEPAVRLGAYEDRVDHRLSLLLGGVRVRYRLADALGDACEHPPHGQEDQVLLRIEVVGQDGLAHPGLVRHILQREAVHPLLAHHLVGAPDQVRLLRSQRLAATVGALDQAVRLRHDSAPLIGRIYLLNSGLRFSINAEMPSLASSLSNSGSTRERSISRPSSSGLPIPPCTASFMDPMASPAPPASFSAYRRVSSSRSPAGKSRSRMPNAWASEGGIVRPVTMRSSALLTPIRRGRRWVPPLPGRRPSVASGSPSTYSPSAPKRRSHARAISSPPPRAVAPSWAMNTFGVRAISERPSWAWLTMRILSSTLLASNALMSAPAEKNLSLALRKITAPAPSSSAAERTPSLSSSMNDRS